MSASDGKSMENVSGDKMALVYTQLNIDLLIKAEGKLS